MIKRVFRYKNRNKFSHRLGHAGMCEAVEIKGRTIRMQLKKFSITRQSYAVFWFVTLTPLNFHALFSPQYCVCICICVCICVSKIPNMATARTIIRVRSFKETETNLHDIESCPTSVLARCFLLYLSQTDVQMAVKLGKQWSDPEQSITLRQ